MVATLHPIRSEVSRLRAARRAATPRRVFLLLLFSCGAILPWLRVWSPFRSELGSLALLVTAGVAAWTMSPVYWTRFRPAARFVTPLALLGVLVLARCIGVDLGVREALFSALIGAFTVYAWFVRNDQDVLVDPLARRRRSRRRLEDPDEVLLADRRRSDRELVWTGLLFAVFVGGLHLAYRVPGLDADLGAFVSLCNARDVASLRTWGTGALESDLERLFELPDGSPAVDRAFYATSSFDAPGSMNLMDRDASGLVPVEERLEYWEATLHSSDGLSWPVYWVHRDGEWRVLGIGRDRPFGFFFVPKHLGPRLGAPA